MRELNLPVQAPRAKEGRVQDVDAVGGSDDLNANVGGEAVELVEKLEHCALDLPLPPRGRVVPFGTDRVDLVNEDNRRRALVRELEHLPHQLGAVPQVLLDELRTHNAQEGRRRLVRNRLGEERLACAGGSVQDDALGRLDANVLVELGVCHGQLDGLFDLLDLRFQPSNVGVRLERGLVHLHHGHEGVGVVGEHPNDGQHLVVSQHGAPGLQEVPVHETQDVDIVLWANRGGHNGVVVINHLLQSPYPHGRPAEIVHLCALLLGFLLLGLEALLVLDELLLHQQVVFHSLKFQKP
mmetsp:Transcript_25403/g.61188  ORF Transcript_25403/g.61188 Transcript_25403/m.61188 type:complete len:296 (-) Transcript_25403:1868-2755(-)